MWNSRVLKKKIFKIQKKKPNNMLSHVKKRFHAFLFIYLFICMFLLFSLPTITLRYLF